MSSIHTILIHSNGDAIIGIGACFVMDLIYPNNVSVLGYDNGEEWIVSNYLFQSREPWMRVMSDQV